ncbi:PREDICTED: adenylyltransferase and sulfurtransferase MOCS3 isoform X1 [Ceratosolen solmsi marchali]|uniref:Adenylyltransferase and sulfurtransferase MOCS3 homolog n=1 Tax=Ceratosolen solmsi marchali TaxID=326594 RepID=A0AAJ6VIX7_9HYME|nr:PREDICTED: adenylyltransferase and sulfurtransferase MOCS3 isoform X1 [Ceratosolen solmsi marchali]
MDEQYLLKEIASLKEKLREKEDNLAKLRFEKQILQGHGLNNGEIARYSRQILLPEIGVKGQLKLKNSSVLVVGVGGLGCPSALYLAGSGVGHIGIVDYDDIEITNLQRQLLFSSLDIGKSKVIAAKEILERLNDNIKITPYKLQIQSSNALEIIQHYDVILDATDNVATRYLLNDACVISGKPLISGSALQFEGQLTVYNYAGPCYRCIFPKPPPPEAVNNCSDSGVLGAVVGTIGVMQALQTIKVILKLPGILSGRLLIFDGMDMTFKNLKLRSKNQDCEVCGRNPTIQTLIDYEEFCGSKANDKHQNLKILTANERISVNEYNELSHTPLKPFILIDIRSNQEYEMCHLKNSINIPFSTLSSKGCLDALKKEINKNETDISNAVRALKNYFTNSDIQVKDIIGGLHAWSHDIDPEFPIY